MLLYSATKLKIRPRLEFRPLFFPLFKTGFNKWGLSEKGIRCKMRDKLEPRSELPKFKPTPMICSVLQSIARELHAAGFRARIKNPEIIPSLFAFDKDRNKEIGGKCCKMLNAEFSTGWSVSAPWGDLIRNQTHISRMLVRNVSQHSWKYPATK